MARTNQGEYEPASPGQPSNSRERIAALLRDIKRQPYPFPEIVIVAVRCGNCGQGLLDLLRIPQSLLYPRNPLNPPSIFFQPPAVGSPNDLYIERNEVHGWRWDRNILRPTRYHLEQQQQVQKEIWAKSRTETKRLRQCLANRSRRVSGDYFTRALGKQGDPWRRLSAGTILEVAPESIECPQCHADVHIALSVVSHDDVR
jgi:hypothetical protein